MIYSSFAFLVHHLLKHIHLIAPNTFCQPVPWSQQEERLNDQDPSWLCLKAADMMESPLRISFKTKRSSQVCARDSRQGEDKKRIYTSSPLNRTDDVRKLGSELLGGSDGPLFLYLTSPALNYPSFTCSSRKWLDEGFPCVRPCARSENTGMNRREKCLPHGASV